MYRRSLPAIVCLAFAAFLGLAAPKPALTDSALPSGLSYPIAATTAQGTFNGFLAAWPQPRGSNGSTWPAPPRTSRTSPAHAEMADAVQGPASFFARASARLAQLAVYERIKAVTHAAR